MTHILNSRKVRGIVAVRAQTSDVKAAIDSVNRAFEEFKSEHTKELNDIKAGLGDVVQTEKVDRINEQIGVMSAAIDDLNVKMALGNVPAKDGDNDSPEMKEYKSDFNNWVRTGEGEGKIRSANKADGVMASMSVGSNPDGGFTAPVEWDRQITDKLATVSPMRRFASIQNVRGQGFGLVPLYFRLIVSLVGLFVRIVQVIFLRVSNAFFVYCKIH